MAAPRDDRAGVRQTWKALTEAGYTIVVQDGAGEEFAGLDKKQAVAEVMSCDDGYFLVSKDGEYVGWVWFVYGNSPEEVICDHTTNLSHVLDPLTEKWWK
jgi:hypothetical protein